MFNAAALVGVVGLIIAVAVWVRTRRVGPVAGVMVAAFVVMAIADQSILTKGSQAVGKAVTWAIENVLTF
jgi:hypothetical protein